MLQSQQLALANLSVALLNEFPKKLRRGVKDACNQAHSFQRIIKRRKT